MTPEQTLDDLIARLRGADGLERARAANRLKELADPKTLARLAEVARDPGTDRLGRRDAIDLIAGAKAPSAGFLLSELALDGRAPSDARSRAIIALAEREPPALAAAADALALDRDAVVRATLVAQAGRLPRARAETLARAALTDESRDVRGAAHLPIQELQLATLIPSLVEAIAKTPLDLEAEVNGGNWDRAREEDALLRGLRAVVSDEPACRRAVAPILPRLVARAASVWAYDAQQGLLTGRHAAEVLAATGVDRGQVADLAAILLDPEVEPVIRVAIAEALGRTEGDEAAAALREELARAAGRR